MKILYEKQNDLTLLHNLVQNSDSVLDSKDKYCDPTTISKIAYYPITMGAIPWFLNKMNTYLGLRTDQTMQSVSAILSQ